MQGWSVLNLICFFFRWESSFCGFRQHKHFCFRSEGWNLSFQTFIPSNVFSIFKTPFIVIKFKFRVNQMNLWCTSSVFTVLLWCVMLISILYLSFQLELNNAAFNLGVAGDFNFKWTHGIWNNLFTFHKIHVGEWTHSCIKMKKLHLWLSKN